jgi:hypothetical protein
MVMRENMESQTLKVKKLTWFETHGGMWWRAEVLGQVYEVPAGKSAASGKAKCQRKFDAFIREAVTYVETK